MTLVEKVKFYTSLCLGTTALLSAFAFLFLIPFVVDPSIMTIMANFKTEPVVCITASHIYTEGLSNCTWTSCKEGCTSVTPRCHQMYVNYSEILFRNFIRVTFIYLCFFPTLSNIFLQISTRSHLFHHDIILYRTDYDPNTLNGQQDQ